MNGNDDKDNKTGGKLNMFFKVIGAIIAIGGLILPGMMVNRTERWKNKKKFLKWTLWFIVGIAIAGLGVWIFQMGA